MDEAAEERAERRLSHPRRWVVSFNAWLRLGYNEVHAAREADNELAEDQHRGVNG